jgi:hypothetical protein
VRRADLDRLKVPVSKVLPFVSLPDHLPLEGDSAKLRKQVSRRAQGRLEATAGISLDVQADLFA